jgi:hypothetical protein
MVLTACSAIAQKRNDIVLTPTQKAAVI